MDIFHRLFFPYLSNHKLVLLIMQTNYLITMVNNACEIYILNLILYLMGL